MEKWEEVRDQIRKWCDEEGIFDSEKKDPLSDFNFVVNFPVELEHKINILKPGNSVDRVVIVSGMRLDEEVVRKLEELPESELEEFLWDLRFTLGNRPTEFELRRPKKAPEAIIVTSSIYFDGLTKDRLMTTLREVYKSKLLATWKIRKKVGF
jgi:hypothetical protein